MPSPILTPTAFSVRPDLISENLSNTALKEQFKTIFEANQGNWQLVKAQLLPADGFTPELVQRMEFTYQLSAWSDNNAQFVALFQQKKADFKDTRAIALRFNKAAFIEEVKATAPAGVADPQAYAANLYHILFHIEPTALLVNLVKDPAVPLLNNETGEKVAALLAQQPTFNIKTESVYSLLNNAALFEAISVESREAVRTELKTLQRIVAVSAVPEAVPLLYNAKLHTALQIAEMPQAQFTAWLQSKGLDERAAQQIHSTAQQSRVRNEQALIALKERQKGTGIALIDKAMTFDNDSHQLRMALAQKNLSYDLLFGDTDFCECGECTSVYSAAAYFVELLQYLRNNNLDAQAGGDLKIKDNPKDISGTPLEKLFNRRPDLAHLELTCQNTNTVLPYIDLVNEVMEQYVLAQKTQVFNVEEETSSELLSEPRHTTYEAYRILNHAVFPFTLPYHQAIDASRIYLKQLDTKRIELLETFRKRPADPDAQLEKLKIQVLERAVDAEYLGLTQKEYIILTKESFESKALKEKLENQTLRDEQYHVLIGLLPVWFYYGFEGGFNVLPTSGIEQVKKEFLPRTGLDYLDLVALLRTNYLNPAAPGDKIYLLIDTNDDCSLDKAKLQHVDGTPLSLEEYDKFHRFIRLWRKLDWSIAQTDQAIMGLSTTREINPEFLHQLTLLKKLSKKTGLDPIQLLTFWGDISTKGEQSLYRKLFLRNSVVGIDTVFQADATGNYLTGNAKISEHQPAIMAALNLSADDMEAITTATRMTNELTIQNLSVLYRYRLLSKTLGLRVAAFLEVLPLFGDVFNDAETTWAFWNNWGKIEEAGFTPQQLNFIINSQDDSKNPLAPSQKTVLQIAKTLYDGLNTIDKELEDKKENKIETEPRNQKNLDIEYHFVVSTLSTYTGLEAKRTEVLLSEILEQDTSAVFLNKIFEKIKESAIPTDTNWVSYLIALKKVALLVSTFDLNVDEIRFFQKNAEHFDDFNFNAFSLAHFFRLEAYTRLRNALPASKLNILDFWKYTHDANPDSTQLSEKIAELTQWKKANIDQLLAAHHFDLLKKDDFQDEKNLLRLQHALSLADKIGVDIKLLFAWAIPDADFDAWRTIAESIKNTLRARYPAAEWEQVIKPLHDELRGHQKQALTDYLLQQKTLQDWGVHDANGLFEFFLIDVQMEACMETSRIKQAISSVQLFIQRCFLGLEETQGGIKPNVLDRTRWEWMQRYRVWEANRKVFLYPENWIESNLRDDKSPFFKELESELLQKDISKQTVADALKNYLYKVDEVANMEVIGLYIDGDKNLDAWSKGAKVHVFSRTRNAPFFFYYRYLALDKMNWYPWEKMQVDIPSYEYDYEFFYEPFPFGDDDFKTFNEFKNRLKAKGRFLRIVNNENEHKSYFQLSGSGCYLTPVVWNDRLFIFFPQIMPKTKPKPNGDKTIRAIADEPISNTKPDEYYEIKMAWSEYRNGKWLQKQLSKDKVDTKFWTVNERHQIQFFKFVPVAKEDRIIINLDDFYDDDNGYMRAFEFDGNVLKICNPFEPSPAPIEFFGREKETMYAWQFKNNAKAFPNIYFQEEDSLQKDNANIEVANYPFYHTDIKKLTGLADRGQLTTFFEYNLAVSDVANVFGGFDHDNNLSTPLMFHELKRPYSLYNWELFFHTPMALANELSKSQHFEEAMKWYHYVFNPMADGSDDKRFWQFKPLKDINSQNILDAIFGALQANTANQAIMEWRDKPFMPHVVARSRPVAYMKWVVMKYIDNLVAWGDSLFRQDTIESINEATQLYVLAWHILGEKPKMLPKQGKITPQTYISLLDQWDAFSNALVELELVAPFSKQIPLGSNHENGQIPSANVFGVASTLYFCIPNNPKLMGYWDTIADRLYKIRHCQNIQGVFRKLPLFEPPIDPALLVKAAAQGLSIASVLNEFNTPMPNYRFYYLLQKALELCNELKSMGTAMLSAIEKKDNESITLIRAKHEGVMHNLVMEIKKQQLEEAEKNLESLQQNRKAPEKRMKYYLKLAGLDEGAVPNDTAEFNGLPNEIVTVEGDSGLKLISFEKEDMDKASEAADLQDGIGKIESLASLLHALPQISTDIKPFGTGTGISIGGSNFGSVTQAIARWMQTDAAEHSFASSQAGKKGAFQRALQDRIQQANQAGFELKQIDKQITASKIRMDIANQEISNQQKMMDNAQEIEDFLKNKYSNEELYTWMRGSLKNLYYQVYSLANELAKKAEQVFRFERGLSSSNFIQAGYWDMGRDGLLAGEQLYVGLKQLEAAYHNERGYDYEITKHISLRQINPLALLRLRETSKCEFALAEALFDLDYPGHYKRRIKSLSLSIPCIAGPYTGINASFRLLENKFRNTAISGQPYQENTQESDERFSNYIIPISAIAASTAQNDSGIFELNFKDERYLPFEGAGCTSKWSIELPEIRQFDYDSIVDVIINLRYTAVEGGERFKKEASESVQALMKNTADMARDEGFFTILDLKHDLGTEWHKGTTMPNTVDVFELDLSKIAQFMPYYLQAKQDALKVNDVILLTDLDLPAADFKLLGQEFSDGEKVGKLFTKVLTQSMSIKDWKLTLPAHAKNAKKMILILRMKG